MPHTTAQPDPAANRTPGESDAADPVHAAYDRLVDHSPQASVYCRRWWLQAVAPDRWQILSVTKKNHLQAAWPIVTQTRRGRTDVLMPPMTQKLGILFPPADPRRKYAEQLSSEHQLIEKLIEQLPGSGSFEHSFHENFTNHLPFYWHRFTQTTRYTYILPDLADLDTVWNGFRTSARTAIRRCRENDLKVIDDLDFEQLLDLNDLTFRRQGLAAPVPRDVLRRIDQACRANAGRKVFAARDARGRLHAALYLVHADRVAYYLMLGSDPALRASNASTLLLWEAIRFAATVADRFDFEGSMMRNVEASLRDLGARQVRYSLIRRPPPPSLLGRAWRKVRYLTRGIHRPPQA